MAERPSELRLGFPQVGPALSVLRWVDLLMRARC